MTRRKIISDDLERKCPITWRLRPKRCGAPRTARSYFVLPVSYRRRRSPTPCAAITAMSLCFSKSAGTEAFDPAVGNVARRVGVAGQACQAAHAAKVSVATGRSPLIAAELLRN
jgi:hypothetical protein